MLCRFCSVNFFLRIPISCWGFMEFHRWLVLLCCCGEVRTHVYVRSPPCSLHLGVGASVEISHQERCERRVAAVVSSLNNILRIMGRLQRGLAYAVVVHKKKARRFSRGRRRTRVGKRAAHRARGPTPIPGCFRSKMAVLAPHQASYVSMKLEKLGDLFFKILADGCVMV